MPVIGFLGIRTPGRSFKVYCHNSGVKRYCDAPAAIGGGHIGGVLVFAQCGERLCAIKIVV
jgi:hypothetical protein